MTLRKAAARKVLVSTVAIVLTLALFVPMTGKAEEQGQIEVKAVDGAAFDAASNAGSKVYGGYTEDTIMTMALGVAAIGTFYAAAPQVMIIGAAMGVGAVVGAKAISNKMEAAETKPK